MAAGKDPAFLFYPGDYLRDTLSLSEKTQVAYDCIMCEHMRNICITPQQLKILTKQLNEDELSELLMVLSEVDGGYQIEWIAVSISNRRAYSESRRRNRTGKPKKDMIEISSSYDQHMENESENENKKINGKGDARGKTNDGGFEEFWEKYHSITGRRKTDKKPAHDAWKKLTSLEQQKAIENIDDYSSTEDVPKFRKKARKYLTDKNFNDEFEVGYDPEKAGHSNFDA